MGVDDHLIEQLSSPENLLLAWRNIRGNIPRKRREKSAGPDGVTLAAFEADLTAELNFLRESLVTCRYQPQLPVTYRIPKRGGGYRDIVVLNVRDRVAQRATQQVVEPIWDPTFLDCSFGFRPGLSVENAIHYAQQLRIETHRWVVDGDITDCFPSLDHEILMRQVQRRVRDRKVLELVQNWLDIGIMMAGPPEDDDTWLDKAQSVTRMVQHGTDWVLSQATDDADPYLASRYEGYSDDIEGLPASLVHEYEPRRSQSRVVRRLVTNGLILGSGWIRGQVGNVGTKALGYVKTPAGRRFLRKSARASSAMAGIALTAAAVAYLLNRRAGPVPTGVLQGSPLSPLLANIYLHLFDLMMDKRHHNLVRFADDWVVLSPTRREAERAYHDAEWALGRLKLQLNPDKTAICHPDEKVSWLGGVIR